MKNLSTSAKAKQYLAQRRIHEASLDRITITVKKGRKQVYKDYATGNGMSLNSLFVTAVERFMKGGSDETN